MGPDVRRWHLFLLPVCLRLFGNAGCSAREDFFVRNIGGRSGCFYNCGKILLEQLSDFLFILLWSKLFKAEGIFRKTISSCRTEQPGTLSGRIGQVMSK